MKWLSKKAMPTEEKYMSDEDIEKSYGGYKIVSLTFQSPMSGTIEIEYPQPTVTGDDYRVDQFIIYKPEGMPAFNQWYPEKMYMELANAIEDKRLEKYTDEQINKYYETRGSGKVGASVKRKAGTWSLPNTLIKAQKLIDVYNSIDPNQTYGEEGKRKVESDLYDLFGDDNLFNRIDIGAADMLGSAIQKAISDEVRDMIEYHDKEPGSFKDRYEHGALDLLRNTFGAIVEGSKKASLWLAQRVAFDFSEGQTFEIGDYAEARGGRFKGHIISMDRVRDVYKTEEEFKMAQDVYGNTGLTWDGNEIMTVHIEKDDSDEIKMVEEFFIYEIA